MVTLRWFLRCFDDLVVASNGILQSLGVGSWSFAGESVRVISCVVSILCLHV